MPDQLVDFSNPKRFVDSLMKNREAINGKVDAFTAASKRALDNAVDRTTEFLINNADRAGGLLVWTAGLAGSLTAIGLGTGAIDPNILTGTPFKDFSTVQSAVTSAGLFVDAALLIPIGKNLMARRPAMDSKGFE